MKITLENSSRIITVLASSWTSETCKPSCLRSWFHRWANCNQTSLPGSQTIADTNFASCPNPMSPACFTLLGNACVLTHFQLVPWIYIPCPSSSAFRPQFESFPYVPEYPLIPVFTHMPKITGCPQTHRAFCFKLSPIYWECRGGL